MKPSRTIHSALCILHCALFMSAAYSADMNLAVRGNPAEYLIVIPEAASESQLYAAEELRDFTVRVTGVTLPIVTDAEPLPAKAILLGETRHTAALLSEQVESSKLKVESSAGEPPAPPEGDKTVKPSNCQTVKLAEAVGPLGPDGFRLVARPPHLLVVASPVRGTLYGVYEILERFAGCRWYASWHSVIPNRYKVIVPDNLDDTQVPAFVMRDPGWYDVRQNPEFAARLKVNQPDAKYANMKKIGGVVQLWSRLNICHTFQYLLPPSEYAGAHPEYFALVNGVRKTTPLSGAGAAEPCLTNPDVLRIVTSNVLAYIRQNPGYPIYGVSQNDDWDDYCRCPNCAAVDEEEGSHSGTVVRFVNAVAEAVEREFPDKKIETLAYNWSRKPPAKTILRDNVVVYLCTMGCERSRPFPDARANESISFREDLRNWQSVCNNVAIWDYITNFSHYLSPYPNVYGLFGNIPWYRDVGVQYLFTQADSAGAHGDFSALKAWVGSKLMWNPDLPLGPLLDEFFQGFYGAAAPFVREYFEKLHLLELAFTEEPSHFLGTYPDPVNPALPESFIVEATNLWQKAQEAVNGDMIRTYNVRMGAITMDYMRFMRDKDDVARWQMCLAPKTRSTEKFSEAQMLASRLLDVLESENNIALSEGNHASRVQELRDYLEMEQPPLPILCGASAVIEEKDIPYAKNLAGVDWGSYVDDPGADDGRAMRLITRSSNQGVRYNLRNIEFEDGAKYRIRARVRVDKAGDGVAFHTGLLNTPSWPGSVITSIERRTEEVTNEYTWYDVATYDPTNHPFASFYISSGDYPQGGQSAVRGIYLDKIEVSKILEPGVTIDSVTQRWPWKNKVDITYTVVGGTDMSAHEYRKIKFKATINGREYIIDGSRDLIAPAMDGTYTVTWTNPPSGIKATGCTMGATMYATTGDYMIIDLNTGNMALEDLEAGDSCTWTPTAANARYNTGLYKTDWLVLRRVPRTADAASNYSGGYPTGHANYSAPTYSGTYTNTATTWTTDKDFYAGLFMLTGSQYERVMGENYSYSFRAYGTNVRDWCPASAPAYNTLRNSKVATAPLSSSLASVSFFERLNAMTGVCGFDLPTEVMWEIATRAGDRRVYWWNDSCVWDDLCWRVVFSGERVTGPNNAKTLSFSVGLRNNGTMRTPNAWGLFDTMGNLQELCRDVGYYGDLKDAPNAFTPKYDPAATRAMGRGGYWEAGGTSARFHASYREPAFAEITSMAANYVGFRVFFVAP